MADNRELGFSIKILGTDQQVNDLAKVEQGLKQLSDKRKELNALNRVGAISEQEYAAQITKVNLETKNLRQTKGQLQRAIEVENTLTNKQVGSYNELSNRLNKLRQDYRNLGEADREGAKGAELLKNIDGLDEKLKDLDAGMGQYQRNVGNYKSAIEGLTSSISVGGISINQYNNITQNLITSISNYRQTINAAIISTESQTAATKAGTLAVKAKIVVLKLLRNAWIATGIGAFVLILLGLVKAFTSTQKGADTLRQVLRPLQAIFGTLIGFIQNVAIKIFDRLSDAVSNPKQAFIDLGNVIKDNIINRFKSFAVFGQAFAKIFQGDLVEGFKQLGDAAIQFGTGIEGATDKLNNFVNDTNKAVQDAANKGRLIADLEKDIEEIQIRNAQRRSKLLADVKKYNDIAEDTSKGEKERADAALKAIEANDAVLKLDQELINAKIKLKETEQSLNDTSRAEQLELEELKAELFDKETERQEARTTLRNKFNVIQDQVARERLAKAKELSDEEAKYIEETSKKIADLSTTFIDQRIELMEEGFEKEKALLETKAAREIEVLQKQFVEEKGLQGQKLEDAKRINNLIADAIIQINQKLGQDLYNLGIEQSAKSLELQQKLSDDRIKQLEAESKLAELVLARQLRNDELTHAEASNKLYDLRRESALKQLEVSRTYYTQVQLEEEALKQKLSDLNNQAQTEETERQRKAIEESLVLLDEELLESGVKIEEFLAYLDELKAEKDEERGGSFLSSLFNISEEDASALKDKLGQQFSQIYNNIFALEQQAIQNNLKRKEDQYKASNEKLLAMEDDRLDKEKAKLKNQLDRGIISEQTYNNRLQNLEKVTASKKEQIAKNTEFNIEAVRRQSFERQKRLSILKATIDGAAAVMRILADVPKVDFGVSTALLIAGAVATTGLQIGLIAGQKYAKGGFLAEGPSHARGGIKGVVGDRMIEFEGGEVIINKKSAAAFMPELSAINSYKGYGSKLPTSATYLQSGGYVARPVPPGIPVNTKSNGSSRLDKRDLDYLAATIAGGVGEQVNNKKVVLTQTTKEEFENEVQLTKSAETW